MDEPKLPDALRRFDLSSRVAIVTGASSGLGPELARALASVGARVAVVARREDRLAALAAEIGGLAVGADLLDLARIGELMSRVAAGLGPPEILVNVAGNRFSAEPAEDEPLKAIRQTLDLNLIAPFRLAQEIFPHMRAASKLGLSGLTAELAVQWARHGIRVNTVASGFFRSEITDSLYTEERSLTWLRRNTPLPRHGAPEDFTGAVLWLASDASQYVTGQTILVDGGWTAR